MQTSSGLHKVIFWVLSAIFLLSGAAHAYDISGTVSYSGSKTGRIYIGVKNNNNSIYGVSIDAPGPFTIRGVPYGTYFVGAFMDSVGDGIIHPSDPAGLIPNVDVAGYDVPEVVVMIADPAPVPPAAPDGVHAYSPGVGTAAITWDNRHTPYGPFNAVIPDTYNLYWSTNPDVMSNVTGSKTGIPANDKNNFFFLNGLTNGQAYYFLMTGATGTIISAGSTTASVTVSAPAGGYSVSGSVDYSGFNPGSKKLYVMLWGNDGMYYQKINLPASPVSPQPFTVAHVKNGSYWVYPVFDMNNNGLLDEGDMRPLENAAPLITVNNAIVSNVTVTITAVNAGAEVTTYHYKDSSWESYNLGMNISGMGKQPVNIVMTGGPQISGPVDMAIDPERGGFYAGFSGLDRPNVGDSYEFDVTYSDTSTDTITAQVTDVLDSFPTPVSPLGSIPYNETPTFTWQAPSSPPSGEYTYNLWLNSDKGIWWDTGDLPSTQLSAVYNSVGDSSSPTLSNNSSYWWSVAVRDSKGNSAAQQVQFIMGAGISGKVTSDGATGIGGVWVTAYTGSYSWAGNAITNADGTYAIGGLAPGSYKVNFSANTTNYMSEWYNDASDFASAAFVPVVADQTTQNINATLAQGSGISGRVTNGTTGIQNVGVSVCKYDGMMCNWGYNGASTDASGNYVIGGLPAGQYKVQFNAGSTGYVSEWYNNKPDLASATTVTVNLGVTKVLADAVLATGGGISGKVTNGTTGIQNVWVSVCKVDGINCNGGYNGANTDASGSYVIGGLPAGQYKVQFNGNMSGYASEWYNNKADLASATTVTVTAGATKPLADAVLAQLGGISGRVTNGTTGIQNVWVYPCKVDGMMCMGYGGASTDATGNYVISGLPAGQYKVQFNGGMTGYVSEWYNNKADLASATTVTVSLGVTKTLADAVLAQGGGISGKVTNGTTGIQNISVQVCKYDGINCNWGYNGANTDMSGNYVISGLPAGQYKVQFNGNMSGYASEWYNNKADLASATTVTVTAGATKPLADAVLAQLGGISGRVTNGTTGIQNVWVSTCKVDGMMCMPGYNGANTDASGNYVINGLPAGQYKVQFNGNMSGYASEWYNNKADLASATTVTVTAGATKPLADAVLDQMGGISGKVTNGTTGIQNVGVSVCKVDGMMCMPGYIGVNTDASGNYVINGLPAGQYKVQFYAGSTGYVSEWYNNKPDMASADTVTVTLGVIEPLADAVLAQGGGISGKVTNGTTGIQNVSVQVCKYDGINCYWGYNGANTDGSGSYVINGLPAGQYKVQFNGNMSGYASEWYNNKADLASATTVTVTAGATKPLADAVLAQLGGISGKVTNGTTGIQSVWVSACKYDGMWCMMGYNAYTDATGNYVINGLPAGQYKVQFNAAGTGYVGEWYNNKPDLASATTVTVTAGATKPLADAVLVQGGGISGKVTNGTTGIQGVSVQVCKYDGINCNLGYNGANTDASGNYIIGDLPAGQYKVQFNGGMVGYASEWYNNKADLASATTVTVAAGATKPLADAVLVQLGGISGKVTNGTIGIPDVSVQVCKYDGMMCMMGYNGANTDASGNYVIGGLPAGQYKVQFNAGSTGYISEWYNNKPDLASATTVTVNLGVTKVLADAVLAQGGGISGKVTDGTTGIQNVSVQVCKVDGIDCNWGYNGANTDASGNYIISGLPAGQYKVQFNGGMVGYASEWYNDKADDVISADTVTITTGATKPLADAVLARLGGISGRVTNGTTGIQNVWVSVCKYDGIMCMGYGGAYTDMSGNYVINSLPEGPYKVQFNGGMVGYATEWYNDKVDVTSADTVDVPLGVTEPLADAVLGPAI